MATSFKLVHEFDDIPIDLFERYLDVPLGGRRPYLTKDDFGIDRWVIEGRLFPVPEGYDLGGYFEKVARDGFVHFGGEDQMEAFDDVLFPVALGREARAALARVRVADAAYRVAAPSTALCSRAISVSSRISASPSSASTR